MGKKYLETKKDSLESSVLGVWKTAIEEGDARESAVMDGRTKSYREHRKKLESTRNRREEKKVNKEEVDLDEASVEEIEELYLELSDEEFDAILEEADEEFLNDIEIFFTEDIQGIYEKPGLLGKIAKKVGKAVVSRIPGTSAKRKRVIAKAASREKQRGAKAAKIGAKRKEKQAYSKAKGYLKTKKKASVFGDEKLPNMRDALMQVRTEKHDTHVDPEDREELDKEVDGEGGVETAKKMKRAKEPAPNISEASGDKEAYKKFFDAALKKFKVTSPAELEGDDKKKFFDYIDKNWEGDNEKAEGAMSQVREFKIQSMKAALARVWGMKEGKNPFKKEDDDKENKKRVKTETGKKAAVIDINPKIAD